MKINLTFFENYNLLDDHIIGPGDEGFDYYAVDVVEHLIKGDIIKIEYKFNDELAQLRLNMRDGARVVGKDGYMADEKFASVADLDGEKFYGRHGLTLFLLNYKPNLAQENSWKGSVLIRMQEEEE